MRRSPKSQLRWPVGESGDVCMTCFRCYEGNWADVAIDRSVEYAREWRRNEHACRATRFYERRVFSTSSTRGLPSTDRKYQPGPRRALLWGPYRGAEGIDNPCRNAARLFASAPPPAIPPILRGSPDEWFWVIDGGFAELGSQELFKIRCVPGWLPRELFQFFGDLQVLRELTFAVDVSERRLGSLPSVFKNNWRGIGSANDVMLSKFRNEVTCAQLG